VNRFNENEINAVVNVIKNGKYLSGFTSKYYGGEQVQKFEEKFARFIGVKHALTFNSGTTALLVAFRAIIEYEKRKRGKKSQIPSICLPAYTFTADPSAALLAHGKIIFEDIDEKSYCMLPVKQECQISVPTYLLGNAPDKIGRGKSKFLIEDCCQALGTKVNGKVVGSMGDLSVFSFQETKHITTLGEGGMICSNNEELIEIAAAIRNHAEFYREEKFLGYNFRMTEAQAAFGIEQLKKINSILTKFRNNARYIMKKLPNGIEPPYISPKVEHSFLMIGCLYNEKQIGIKRNIFLEKLTQNRKHILENDEKSDIRGINMRSGKFIGTGYSKPLYDIHTYKKYKPKNGCPKIENLLKKSLWMDIHKFRTRNEISEELDILNDTIKKFQK